jgi:uncharacterized protein (TIGR02996 family)
MTHEEAFLQDILEHPEDDTPRLIYADWLDDHGDPGRAEFIRVQIELTRLGEDDPRRPELSDREEQLLTEHENRWGEPLKSLGAGSVRFRRGLIDFVELNATTLAEQAEAIFAAAPIRQVSLEEADGDAIERLAQLSPFARLQTLIVKSRRRVEARGAIALANSPHLANLSSLWLIQTAIGIEGVQALTASEHLRTLTELSLHCNDLQDDSAFALAASPFLGQLTTLDLGWNSLESAGACALLASPFCARLESLNLDDNGNLGPDVAHALATATHLRRLTELNLDDARIGPEGAAALAGAAHLGSLVRLILQTNQLGDEGVQVLARAPYLDRLRMLWLGHNGLSANGIRSLAGSPCWDRLTELSLQDSVGDAGMEALADSPSLSALTLWDCGFGIEGLRHLASKSFPRLERLDLRLNPLSEDQLRSLLSSANFPRLCSLWLAYTGRMLAEWPWPDSLRELWLLENPLGDEGASALAASPRLRQLRLLSLGACSIGEEGASALATSPHLGRLRELHLYRNNFDLSGPAGKALRDRFGDRVRF